MNFPNTIYEFITTEETNYQTREVSIFDNFMWNMSKHIQTSVSFKYGKFLNASNEIKYKNPFRNIVLTILRLRYRAEDIDIKDVVLYVDDENKYHLSFLVKKYYEDVFLVENDLDTFFDKAKEEKIDLGGCLVRKGREAVPEIVPLQSIAFCDQTDIMAGPIGFKFNFSPDKLRTKAELGWGNKKNGATISLEDLIILAKQEKDSAGNTQTQTNQITGKNIEIYLVCGQMPESYLKENGKQEKVINQIQIVAFYQNKTGKTGQTLYRSEQTDDIYKFHNPEEIYNRALGFGGVEELFDAQIWTNFSEIQKTNMLKAAAKNVLYTNDEAYANRNKIKDMDNLEITVVKDGALIQQVPTGSPNIQLFTQDLAEWENHARELGGATDPLLGKQPPSGTPFRLQERVVFEGKGLHEYRRGKFAKFVEEIYRDWIIPHIKKEITKGTKFLSELSIDEMQFVAENVARNETNKMIIDKILNDDKFVESVFRGEIDWNSYMAEFKQKTQEKFMKAGNKRFIEILKDEFKDAPLKIKVNVAGKQKDLAAMTDKIVNIFRFVFSNPQGFQQVMQIPGMSKTFNEILEYSGLSPVNFGAMPALPVPQTGQGGLPQAGLPVEALQKMNPKVANVV